MASEQLRHVVRYLNDNSVHYRVRSHFPGSRGNEDIVEGNTPDNSMTKTFVVQAGRQRWMVVLRADYRIDDRLLLGAVGHRNVHLVPEKELEALFPNCELDTLPPFGNLYGLPVIVNNQIAQDGEIVFSAYTRAISIRMRYEDFARLVNPTVAKVAVPLHPGEPGTVGTQRFHITPQLWEGQ